LRRELEGAGGQRGAARINRTSANMVRRQQWVFFKRGRGVEKSTMAKSLTSRKRDKVWGKRIGVQSQKESDIRGLGEGSNRGSQFQGGGSVSKEKNTSQKKRKEQRSGKPVWSRRREMDCSGGNVKSNACENLRRKKGHGQE